jgi:hypothetical protein
MSRALFPEWMADGDCASVDPRCPELAEYNSPFCGEVCRAEGYRESRIHIARRKRAA